jgi:Fic family protein
MYTEIQKRGKKKYYYLAHTIRLDSGFKKVRVFLGVDLSKKAIEREIKKKQNILDAKISVIEATEKEPFTLKINFSHRLLTKEQLSKIDSLRKKFAKKLKITDKDILRQVRESFLIKYTYNTNAAEGNTISLKETELIIKKDTIHKSHSLREVHEIENTVTAYNFIESYNGKLDHKFILDLHKLVTKNTLTNPTNEGRYRSKGQNVTMTGSDYFPPKGGREIKKLISKIIGIYQRSKLAKIEATILFHSAFILIHPFIDGNGRVSRLIFNWMLIKERLPPINFPSNEHIEYTDLMEVSRSGDSVPLATHVLDKILNNNMSTEIK